MSLQAQKAPLDKLEEHVRNCTVRYCEICQTFDERKTEQEMATKNRECRLKGESNDR